MLADLLDLATGGGMVTVRHPAHRSPGGEWDGIAALSIRHKRILTGARILTPFGLPPDVAAMEIGARLCREMTPCELADFLRRVAVPAIAEARTAREREARRLHAKRSGARSYYDLRNNYAVLEGYRSLWHRRRTIWQG